MGGRRVGAKTATDAGHAIAVGQGGTDQHRSVQLVPEVLTQQRPNGRWSRAQLYSPTRVPLGPDDRLLVVGRQDRLECQRLTFGLPCERLGLVREVPDTLGNASQRVAHGIGSIEWQEA